MTSKYVLRVSRIVRRQVVPRLLGWIRSILLLVVVRELIIRGV